MWRKGARCEKHWEDLLSEVVGFGEIFKNRIHLGLSREVGDVLSLGTNWIHCHGFSHRQLYESVEDDKTG